MLKHTDTKGLNTQYRYNAAGLLEQCIDANRHQIGYQWDNQGRIQKLTNQNHAEYLFSYNRFGQLVHEQAFDGEEKNYSYNENGQLFQIRQPNVFTQFAYFADGMIASKTYTHVQTRHSQTEEFEYNLNNQLSKAKNKESQSDFYRNALGQLVREHQHYNVPNLKPMTAVLRYEYDELGNLTKTIRPDGQVQTNLSYGSGHIYGIAFNQQDMVAFQRDDLHRETARMLANGLIQSKNYNDVGLLSSQIIRPEQETAGRVQHRAERHYQYDQNYLLTQVNDSRLGRLTYQYDAIGRLTQIQSPHQTESFAFDPAGNLIDPIATQASQVKSNLIAQYQGKNYKYDAQGNVIESSHAGKTLKLTWDNLNRLIQSELNGQATEYGYDVFGRRLYKKNQNAQTLTLFGWEGDLMIWESQQSNDVEENYTKHYVYEPQSFVPLLQTGYTGFIKLLETPDYAQFQHQDYSVYKDPIWKTETRKNKAELERVAFYHCDQVGTPQKLTNELGECVWEIKQDAWGEAIEIKATNALLEDTNIRFQGQYYDDETGLHYNRYRYYEPYSARYVSKDPIGLFGGLNNSSYVSDPNQWVDPMGLTEWTGSSYQVSVLAGTGIKYDLRSQCLNNERGVASIVVGGGSYGRGGTLGAAGSRSVTFHDPYDGVYKDALNGGWGDVSASVVLFRGIGFGKTGLGEASSDGLMSTYDRGVAASAGVSSGHVIPSLSSYKVEACFTNDPRGPICNGRNGRCEKSVPKPKPRSYIDPKTIPEYDPRSHAHIPPNNVNINDIFNKMSF